MHKECYCCQLKYLSKTYTNLIYDWIEKSTGCQKWPFVQLPAVFFLIWLISNFDSDSKRSINCAYWPSIIYSKVSPEIIWYTRKQCLLLEQTPRDESECSNMKFQHNGFSFPLQMATPEFIAERKRRVRC